MTTVDPQTVVLDFIDRINSGDPERIVAAMTADHEFVDSAGSSVQGRETMLAAWKGYFRLFPDYRIHVEHTVERDGMVIVIGRSSGTLSPEGCVELSRPDGTLPPDEQLQGPAVWCGRVREGLIASWRVSDDTLDVRESLGIPPPASGDG